jgi:hypothetical protein
MIAGKIIPYLYEYLVSCELHKFLHFGLTLSMPLAVLFFMLETFFEEPNFKKFFGSIFIYIIIMHNHL